MSKLTDFIFKGARHYITSNFGWRTYFIHGRWATDYHLGTDYGTGQISLPLYALPEENASVFSVGYDSSAGYYIWIWYPRLKVRICYFHMKASAIVASSKITKNQLIGYVGSSGNSSAPHLHLGIRDQHGNYIDPEKFAKTYTPPSGVEQGESMPYFKIIEPMQTPLSSTQLSEGVIAIKGMDNKVRGYNINGDARIKRVYTTDSMSPIFDDMLGEMQRNEILISSDK